jgi:hypothetical protein
MHCNKKLINFSAAPLEKASPVLWPDIEIYSNSRPIAFAVLSLVRARNSARIQSK